MTHIIQHKDNKVKTLFNIDEIDKQAIAILENAPLMTEKEMKIAINKLKLMAKRKRVNGRKNMNDILDDWAYKAYIILFFDLTYSHD
jgi:hypothetical protein